MNAELAAVLKSATGEAVPLRSVSAQGRLTGLLFELVVEQVYENTSAANIEAEFTFPVPHRAVLLGLELEIGARALQAVAVRRQAAREQYERAMDEGDTAALLEQAGDGLWSLSLGNLMAGERALIRYRYAELLDRKGDEVRLAVPTVIAPRYGAPEAHGLDPHQAPGVSLLAAYPFTLAIDVLGEIAGAALRSPSHAIVEAPIEGGRRVTLAPGAFLDRDFVLSLRGALTGSAGLVAPDGDGWVALASLDPHLAAPAASPLALKLLVDCSGSMGGSSIDCARRALLAILAGLGERDEVSLTRFGSSFEHLVPPAGPTGWTRVYAGGRAADGEGRRAGALTKASPQAIEWLRHRVGEMNADLGGTELAGALRAVLDIPVPHGAGREVLLITDAEVWAVEQVLDLAARSGHRLFVVAVGAAPAEALASQLGERTGGACEFVAPGEDAEAAIVRMFKRMREAPKRIARVEWPVAPLWQAPLPVAVFSGDTLHVIAGFDRAPEGQARVVISGQAGGDIARDVALPGAAPHDVLPRLAAARRLTALAEDEAAALAEHYQLASRHTSFVVVQVRDAEGKATALPELRKVPHMLAAGWGAMADMPMARICAERPAVAVCGVADQAWAYDAVRSLSQGPMRAVKWSPAPPRFALGTGDDAAGRPAAFVEALRARLAAGQPVPATLDELRALGLPPGALRALRELLDEEAWRTIIGAVTEAALVGLFIALLVRSPAGDVLEARERRQLSGGKLGDRSLRRLRAALAPAFAGVTADGWTASARREALET